MRRAAWLLFLCPLLAASAACTDDEHPPMAAACNPATMNCPVRPGGGSGVDLGGAGGQGGEGGAAPDPNYTGTVVVFDDIRFDGTTPFTGMAEVSAEAVSGLRVSAPYDGQNPVELSSVKVAAANWFAVDPEDNLGVLLTLFPVDTTSGARPPLPLMREDPVDLVFSVILSSGRLPTRAQAVVRVLNEDGEPLAGVRVVLPQAEFVAYDTGGGWVGDDGAELTRANGYVFLGNIEADAFPGLTERTLTLSTATASAGASIRVSQGAVTVTNVVAAL